MEKVIHYLRIFEGVLVFFLHVSSCYAKVVYVYLHIPS